MKERMMCLLFSYMYANEKRDMYANEKRETNVSLLNRFWFVVEQQDQPFSLTESTTT